MQVHLAGESHGPGIIGIIEDFPSGVPIQLSLIQNEMKRRREGYGRGSRQSLETDRVEILSGIRWGKTLGSPISFLVPNAEWENNRSNGLNEWEEPASQPFEHRVPRPGHADVTGSVRYDLNDLQSVWEISSARRTVGDVVAGSFCKQFLSHFGVHIGSYVHRIGELEIREHPSDLSTPTWESQPLRMPDVEIEEKCIKVIDLARSEGETLGGAATVFATGLPIGLGSLSPMNERLDGQLTQAICSIPAVKGIELGDASFQSRQKGSQAHDLFQSISSRKSNYAGGLEGGLTNGQPLICRMVVKPLSSLQKNNPSLHLDSQKESGNWKVRADIVVVSNAAVIAEARMGWILVNAFLGRFGRGSLKRIQGVWGLHEVKA